MLRPTALLAGSLLSGCSRTTRTPMCTCAHDPHVCRMTGRSWPPRLCANWAPPAPKQWRLRPRVWSTCRSVSRPRHARTRQTRVRRQWLSVSGPRIAHAPWQQWQTATSPRWNACATGSGAGLGSSAAAKYEAHYAHAPWRPNRQGLTAMTPLLEGVVHVVGVRRSGTAVVVKSTEYFPQGIISSQPSSTQHGSVAHHL